MKSKLPSQTFLTCPLFKMRNIRRLAELLGTDSFTLEKLANAGDQYTEWDQSVGGKVRHIESPRFRLKAVQKILAARLMKIKPPDYLFCPVKKRSYVDNAGAHVGSQVFKTLDVAKFFQSVSPASVIRFYSKSLKCAPHVAAILTKLSVYKGHLPTGSPLSPILSYLCCQDMWAELNDVATLAGCKVSVYMDDLTVSGKTVPDALMWQLKKIIRKANLSYHTGRKEKKFFNGLAEVTGVIVKKDGVKPPNRTFLKIYTEKTRIATATGQELKTIQRRLAGLNAHTEHIRRNNQRS